MLKRRAWTVCRFKGGLARKWEVVFLRGRLMLQCTLWFIALVIFNLQFHFMDFFYVQTIFFLFSNEFLVKFLLFLIKSFNVVQVTKLNLEAREFSAWAVKPSCAFGTLYHEINVFFNTAASPDRITLIFVFFWYF